MIKRSYNCANKVNAFIKKSKGFTLIELMIGVAIIGVLSTIGYPSYLNYVTRSDRSEGLRELARIANLEEQFYIDNHSYTATMSDLGLLKATTYFTTEHGLYVISATVPAGGASFTLTATAQGKQATNDTICKTLTITDTGKKTPTTGCWDK